MMMRWYGSSLRSKLGDYPEALSLFVEAEEDS